MVPCFGSTVHKLQGATLNTAVINFCDKHFVSGQKFVARSRLTGLNGLKISAIDPRGLLSTDGALICDHLLFNLK